MLIINWCTVLCFIAALLTGCGQNTPNDIRAQIETRVKRPAVPTIPEEIFQDMGIAVDIQTIRAQAPPIGVFHATVSGDRKVASAILAPLLPTENGVSSGNNEVSSNRMITSNRVLLSLSTPLLRKEPFPPTDIYLFRYNYLSGWSRVNFFYSSGRSDDWRGSWGEQPNQSFEGPLMGDRFPFQDDSPPKGWNIYAFFSWSLDGRWKTDRWTFSNWVFLSD